MISIMKNTSKILFKRKGFLITSLLLPLILVLIFSMLNGGASKYKIGFINNDQGQLGKVIEERLSQNNIIEIINLESDKNSNEELLFHQYEMLITIDGNFTKDILGGIYSKINVKSISKSDMEPTMINILENEVGGLVTLCNNIPVEQIGIEKIVNTFNESKPNYEIENIKNKKVSIIVSLGIIFYLIFIVASMSCNFLLEDEREGTKNRILMGNVSEKQYYGGLSTVFFLLTSIPGLEYFIICTALDYEFGFENKVILLLLVLTFVLFAVMFTVMIASLIKKKTVFTLVNSCFVLPMFMLSGCFWPFEAMGEEMQKIGSLLPPRWIILAIEKLQAGESFISITPILMTLFALIVFLFLLSIFFTRNKIVLVKDK